MSATISLDEYPPSFQSVSPPVRVGNNLNTAPFCYMLPPELKEDHVDVLIINEEDDVQSAQDLAASINKLRFTDCKGSECNGRAVLLDNAVQFVRSKVDQLDMALRYSTHTFAIVTPSFLANRQILHTGHASYWDTLVKAEKGNSFTPVYVVPQNLLPDNIPALYRYLQEINMSTPKAQWTYKLRGIIEPRIHERLSRSTQQEQEVRQYLSNSRESSPEEESDESTHDVSSLSDHSPARDVSSLSDHSPACDVFSLSDHSPTRDVSNLSDQSPSRDVSSVLGLSPQQDVLSWSVLSPACTNFTLSDRRPAREESNNKDNHFGVDDDDDAGVLNNSGPKTRSNELYSVNQDTRTVSTANPTDVLISNDDMRMNGLIDERKSATEDNGINCANNVHIELYYNSRLDYFECGNATDNKCRELRRPILSENVHIWRRIMANMLQIAWRIGHGLLVAAGDLYLMTRRRFRI